MKLVQLVIFLFAILTLVDTPGELLEANSVQELSKEMLRKLTHKCGPALYLCCAGAGGRIDTCYQDNQQCKQTSNLYGISDCDDRVNNPINCFEQWQVTGGSFTKSKFDTDAPETVNNLASQMFASTGICGNANDNLGNCSLNFISGVDQSAGISQASVPSDFLLTYRNMGIGVGQYNFKCTLYSSVMTFSPNSITSHSSFQVQIEVKKNCTGLIFVPTPDLLYQKSLFDPKTIKDEVFYHGITLSHSDCSVTNVQLMKGASVFNNQDCIKVVGNLVVYSGMKFCEVNGLSVRVTDNYGQTFTSSQFDVNVTDLCLTNLVWTDQKFNRLDFVLNLTQGSEEELSFENFKCTYYECCKKMNYYAVKTNTASLDINSSLTYKIPSSFKLPVTSVGEYFFYIQAINEYLQTGYSPRVTVNVSYHCKIHEKVVFSQTEPQKIQNSIAHWDQNDDNYFLVIDGYTGSFNYLKINLHGQFRLKLPPNTCKLEGFRIYKVFSEEEGEITKDFHSKLFSVNDQGDFSLLQNSFEYKHYLVFFEVLVDETWHQLPTFLVNATMQKPPPRPNQQPKFRVDNLKFFLIRQNDQLTMLNLPEIEDEMPEELQVDLLFAPSGFSYSNSSNQIIIQPGKLPPIPQAFFKIRLRDKQGLQKTYSIEIVIKEPIQPSMYKAKTNTSEIKTQTTSALVSNISSISHYGLLTLKFQKAIWQRGQTVLIPLNQKMSIPKNLTEVNSTNIDIWIKPCSETLRKLNISSSEEYSKYFNLSWKPVYFNETKLILKLNFSHPHLLSHDSFEKDLIELNITEPWLFFSSDGTLKHLTNDTLSRGVIPKQTQEGIFRDLSNIQQSVASIVIITISSAQFVNSYWFNAPMSQFVQSMEGLQIMVFQLCKVQSWPVNLTVVLQIIGEIMNFEIIDPVLIIGQMFDFDPDEDYAQLMQTEYQSRVRFQLVDMGFETYNPILNVGGIFFIMLYFFIVTCGAGILKLYYEKCRRPPEQLEGGKIKVKIWDLGLITVKYHSVHYPSQPNVFTKDWFKLKLESCKSRAKNFNLQKQTNKQYNNYFFDAWILLLREAYFPIAISGLLMITIDKQLLNVKIKESLSSYVSTQFYGIFCMVISFVFMPILVLGTALMHLRNNMYMIQLRKYYPVYRRYFFGFYLNLDMYQRLSFLYIIIFVYRRFFLVSTIIFMHTDSAFSWGILMAFNILLQIFILEVLPLYSRQLNRVELFNELMIFLSLCLMSLISEYSFIVKSGLSYEEILEFREKVGLAIIFLILFTFVANLLVIMQPIFEGIRLRITRQCKRFKVQCKKKKEPKKYTIGPPVVPLQAKVDKNKIHFDTPPTVRENLKIPIQKLSDQRSVQIDNVSLKSEISRKQAVSKNNIRVRERFDTQTAHLDFITPQISNAQRRHQNINQVMVEDFDKDGKQSEIVNGFNLGRTEGQVRQSNIYLKYSRGESKIPHSYRGGQSDELSSQLEPSRSNLSQVKHSRYLSLRTGSHQETPDIASMVNLSRQQDHQRLNSNQNSRSKANKLNSYFNQKNLNQIEAKADLQSDSSEDLMEEIIREQPSFAEMKKGYLDVQQQTGKESVQKVDNRKQSSSKPPLFIRKDSIQSAQVHGQRASDLLKSRSPLNQPIQSMDIKLNRESSLKPNLPVMPVQDLQPVSEQESAIETPAPIESKNKAYIPSWMNSMIIKNRKRNAQQTIRKANLTGIKEERLEESRISYNKRLTTEKDNKVMEQLRNPMAFEAVETEKVSVYNPNDQELKIYALDFQKSPAKEKEEFKEAKSTSKHGSEEKEKKDSPPKISAIKQLFQESRAQLQKPKPTQIEVSPVTKARLEEFDKRFQKISSLTKKFSQTSKPTLEQKDQGQSNLYKELMQMMKMEESKTGQPVQSKERREHRSGEKTQVKSTKKLWDD